jgi:hypothetical protein
LILGQILRKDILAIYEKAIKVNNRNHLPGPPGEAGERGLLTGGTAMKKVIAIIFLVAFFYHSQSSQADMLECIGPDGITELTNTSCPDGYVLKKRIAKENRPVREDPTPPKETIPLWKTELTSFCEKSKNSDSLSEYDIQKEINDSEPLRITLETLQINPNSKMIQLKLYRNCKNQFILQQDLIKSRRDGDRILQNLQNQLDRIRGN